jgi:Uma2 family endonuclease
METNTETVAFTDDLLPLRVRPARRITDDELFELCARNKGLRIERTSEGELVIMSPTGSETGNRNFNLSGQLFAWVTANGGFGFDSSTGFVLPNGAERSPDAAWMSNERWLAVPADRKARFAPVCPDLVVELVSPSDRLTDVHGKMREYIENGARLGWLIDRQERRVHVYRANGSVDVLEHPSALDGEDVLSGFRLELARIW